MQCQSIPLRWRKRCGFHAVVQYCSFFMFLPFSTPHRDTDAIFLLKATTSFNPVSEEMVSLSFPNWNTGTGYLNHSHFQDEATSERKSLVDLRSHRTISHHLAPMREENAENFYFGEFQPRGHLWERWVHPWHWRKKYQHLGGCSCKEDFLFTFGGLKLLNFFFGGSWRRENIYIYMLYIIYMYILTDIYCSTIIYMIYLFWGTTKFRKQSINVLRLI